MGTLRNRMFRPTRIGHLWPPEIAGRPLFLLALSSVSGLFQRNNY